MSDETPAKSTNGFDAVSRSVTIIGTVIGVATALHALVVSWASDRQADANDRLAQYKAFREAVTTEETFWRGLYADYQSTISKDIPPPLQAAKQVAIAKLAGHAVPDFKEFRVAPEAIKGAHDELADLKAGLTSALGGPVVSVASSLQDFTTNGGDSKAVTPPPAGKPVSPSVAAVETQASNPLAAQAGTTTLAAGRQDGWDVDVFWCRGPNEGLTYATAQTAAGILAGLSAKAAAIRPGIVLGRIRIRPLPVQINAQAGYQIHGNQVRAEDSERPVAAALLPLINQGQTAPFTPYVTGMRTPFYVSVFACAG